MTTASWWGIRIAKKVNRNNITQGLSHEAKVFYLSAKALFKVVAESLEAEKE